MSFCVFLRLWGQTDALQKAKGLLENLPNVKQLDYTADLSQIRLLSDAPLFENDLIPLLSESGISGFALERA